ncbi:MAG TPA: hypothetical protein VLC28_07420 [Flavitalea sp.]|nr:hypothetical protein [Flavitalea sp.]
MHERVVDNYLLSFIQGIWLRLLLNKVGSSIRLQIEFNVKCATGIAS